MSAIQELKNEISKTQIIMLVGGKGKRLGYPNIPKALIEVAGKTLIEREIELYRDCGFKKFKLLIGHLGEKIINYIGDGSKLGVEVEYAEDPKIANVGKGKALKHAIEIGVIEANSRGIITFPDDLKLDKFLPLKLMAHHLYGVEELDIWATTLLVTSTTYPYGVAKVNPNGIVEEFVEKPKISMFTHVGVCVVEPQVYKLIDDAIDMQAPEAIEYEAVILPKLAREKKLFSMTIPGDDRSIWIPINTRKELEIAEKKLRLKGR
ncbi:MAG: sugar phosphate nucleotidyltransferase [archaeon GB-1867-005]|nr:sugar phosphate nucleotidyltransferase [Candidatus Culexmicrobium cathedralense]